ncbi:hypothetical protein GF380_01570 [Candidatus Uhrbacteria bacterium]|nr:hypothetical protein [Candidatus Uhrbacteria bacterium]MBD3283956.1 hypothetical protein [Candidatus Uhrbacteria bacterium]
MKTIYFYNIDATGKEVEPAYPITMNDDGTIDLSKLPSEIRETLETLGVKAVTGENDLLPADGELFFNQLTAVKTPYMRFRSEPLF